VVTGKQEEIRTLVVTRGLQSPSAAPATQLDAFEA